MLGNCALSLGNLPSRAAWLFEVVMTVMREIASLKSLLSQQSYFTKPETESDLEII